MYSQFMMHDQKNIKLWALILTLSVVALAVVVMTVVVLTVLTLAAYQQATRTLIESDSTICCMYTTMSS